MKEILNWRISLQVQDGPSLGDAQKVEVDAYEKLEVDVPAAVGTTSGTLKVDLQLGNPSLVSCVLIKCSSYEGITAVSQPTPLNPGETAAPITIIMNGPLMLIGSGACKLLGNNLNSLTFSNSTEKKVNIEILIGRDVTG